MIKEAALMTSFRLVPPHPLLFFLMVSGVVSKKRWEVAYSQSFICAVKGSTVILGCRYSYPSSYKFSRSFWTKEWVKNDSEPPDLSFDPNYKYRVQYIGNNQNNCSLKLSDIREQDQGPYYFRFLTTTASGKYQGLNGVTLSIQKPQVVMNSDSVVEGDEVTLTCTINCSKTAYTPTFSWYKQGHPFSDYSFNQLHLSPVSPKDAGSYSCSINGQDYQSPAFTLDVQYPPKNASVSIDHSGEIVKGMTVILTCSSDANPPVHSYTWYKLNESSPVGFGQRYSFILSSSNSGWFYCEAQNKIGSQRSAAVPLTLKESSNILLNVIFGVVAGCGALIVIVIILFIRRNRQRTLTDYVTSGQDNTYLGSDLSSASNISISHPAVMNEDDVQYASIQHRTAGSSVIQVFGSGAVEEVQYATVQHRHGRVVKQNQEHNDLYTNVRLNHNDSAHRSAAPAYDVSVVYNS